MYEIKHHDSRAERRDKRKRQIAVASAGGIAVIAALLALGAAAGRWMW